MDGFRDRPARPMELAGRLEAARHKEPTLQLVDRDRGLSTFALSGITRLAIGRGEGNDVVIDRDPEVSRSHAVLELIGSSWTVGDDGLSRNGTFVNGERVGSRRRLADGDRIRVGRTLLSFHEPSAPVEETQPTPEGRELAELTPAQRRVLVALCRPFAEPGVATPASNREIAEELVLSIEGVRTHMKALFECLGVPEAPPNRKRAELVRRAFSLGVISERDLRSDDGG